MRMRAPDRGSMTDDSGTIPTKQGHPLMRILIIEPFPYGGLLHYSTQLADALAQRGHDVDLIVPKRNELIDRTGPANRRAILPPDATPAPAHATPTQLKIRRARTAIRLLRTWARIARAARSCECDAIVLGGSFDMALGALAGLLVIRLGKPAPIVHVCHNVRPIQRWGGEQLHVSSRPTIALLSRLYPRFDLVFVHGERSRTEFEQAWPPTRLALIPHGDESLFADDPPAPATEPRILFFGAWSKMKGLPVLMDAFEKLLARRPEARLTLAGPPAPEEGESERVLQWAASRPEQVQTLPGYVPMKDVKELFGRARVVVLPYLTAYQSGVAHLAMTMQRAIVATDVGDLPEAVHDGVSGLVVPPRDPAALADALERVLSDATFAERLGAAGRKRTLQGSSWASVAKQVEESLLHLLKKSGVRSA
jgi:glycosyltransferase involved in cell wall biosynthesis